MWELEPGECLFVLNELSKRAAQAGPKVMEVSGRDMKMHAQGTVRAV